MRWARAAARVGKRMLVALRDCDPLDPKVWAQPSITEFGPFSGQADGGTFQRFMQSIRETGRVWGPGIPGIEGGVTWLLRTRHPENWRWIPEDVRRFCWLIDSASDQPSLDAGVPHLLAAEGFAGLGLALNPLVGPIDLAGWGTQAPSSNGAIPERWSDYKWPDWVTEKQRQNVEKFWSATYERGPAAWVRDHVVQRVPATGARVTVRRAVHGWAQVDKMTTEGITGRYLHLWNNIGQVVTDDGEVIPASGGHGSGWLSRWLCADGQYRAKLKWVTISGEGGRCARPCNLAAIRSIVRQCREAGVAPHVQQLGAVAMGVGADVAAVLTAQGNPKSWDSSRSWRLPLRHRAGADPAEWPEDTRVQEFPEGLR